MSAETAAAHSRIIDKVMKFIIGFVTTVIGVGIN